jgi:hypothetical protein
MGEYAHDVMRQDIKDKHGFDIGPYEDDDKPKKHQPQPVYERVKCPHCDKRPKAKGLWQHIQDVHGISRVDQQLAFAKANEGKV